VDETGELASGGVAHDLAIKVLSIRQLHDQDFDCSPTIDAQVAIKSGVGVVRMFLQSIDDCVGGLGGDSIDEFVVVFWIGASRTAMYVCSGTVRVRLTVTDMLAERCFVLLAANVGYCRDWTICCWL
jgi:hypothetical protein